MFEDLRLHKHNAKKKNNDNNINLPTFKHHFSQSYYDHEIKDAYQLTNLIILGLNVSNSTKLENGQLT